jgi:hypothetical protein
MKGSLLAVAALAGALVGGCEHCASSAPPWPQIVAGAWFKNGSFQVTL